MKCTFVTGSLVFGLGFVKFALGNNEECSKCTEDFWQTFIEEKENNEFLQSPIFENMLDINVKAFLKGLWKAIGENAESFFNARSLVCPAYQEYSKCFSEKNCAKYGDKNLMIEMSRLMCGPWKEALNNHGKCYANKLSNEHVQACPSHCKGFNILAKIEMLALHRMHREFIMHLGQKALEGSCATLQCMEACIRPHMADDCHGVTLTPDSNDPTEFRKALSAVMKEVKERVKERVGSISMDLFWPAICEEIIAEHDILPRDEL